MRERVYLFVTASMMLWACDGADSVATNIDPVAVLMQSCTQARQLKPEYRTRQGRSLQSLSGKSFTVTGARLGCNQVDSVALNGSTLTGTLGGRAMSSADFQGAALEVIDADGVLGEVAVTKVDRDANDPTQQTLLYSLFKMDAVTGTAQPICVPDAEGTTNAIPLRGSWDATGAYHADGTIGFNCTSGVIAKCVRWGYRPWQTYQGTSLADYHQACTRLARADYCGDGDSQTQDGTSIDVYDNLNYLTPSGLAGGLFEATWTPQGAYCVSRDRWVTLSTLLKPACAQQFLLSVESSPIKPLDLCLVRRTGSTASAALLSDHTGINLNLSL